MYGIDYQAHDRLTGLVTCRRATNILFLQIRNRKRWQFCNLYIIYENDASFVKNNYELNLSSSIMENCSANSMYALLSRNRRSRHLVAMREFPDHKREASLSTAE